MSHARRRTDDLRPFVAEGGQRTRAGPEADGADEKPVPNWLGPVLLFVLISCCLLPVFFVSLGDWLAAQGFAWPAPRWIVLIGVALFAVGAVLRSHRRRHARGRGVRRS